MTQYPTEEMIAAGVLAEAENYDKPVRELVPIIYLAMRSKDHSMAVDDVREALAILNDSSKPTPDRVRDAKAILTAIGSQSIEGERANG